jgi:hypothetical protein
MASTMQDQVSLSPVVELIDSGLIVYQPLKICADVKPLLERLGNGTCCQQLQKARPYVLYLIRVVLIVKISNAGRG